MSHKNILKPITINGVEIRNRVVMAPMATNEAHPPGYASEQNKAMYGARAKGGVGLIILGGTYSTKAGWDTSTFPGTFRLDIDHTMPSMAGLVERVHAFGAKIFVQLMDSHGRQGSSRMTGVQIASCTAEPLVAKEEDWPAGLRFPGGVLGELPRELSISEIIALEDAAADGAARAPACGFDGIEISCHHGYLAASFLSPRVNRRTDLYGGRFENRMRYILNILRKVREKVGPDYPVGVRLVANEHMEGGLTLDDCVEAAKRLEDESADYINLSDGFYEKMKYIFPDTDGLLLEHGEPQAFKRALKIPVITPSIHNPDIAEKAIANGETDMIEMGRQLLADPDWANKVRDGKAGEITTCDRDCFCNIRAAMFLPVRCKLNRNLGSEQYMPEYEQPPFEY